MLDLNKKEVLRYLGYKRKQPLTPAVDKIIDEMLTEVQTVSKARYHYRIYPITVHADTQTVTVDGTQLVFTGSSAYHHLKNAKKVALLAATLGIEVERQIRIYEVTELTKSLVLDSCCVEYIEEICDLAEYDIEQAVAAEGLTLNRRFSPGYGDLPLTIQPDFLGVLNASNTLGINLSENLLMIPRKSVTAFIGLFDDEALARPRRKAAPCTDCEALFCQFRIGGTRND